MTVAGPGQSGVLPDAVTSTLRVQSRWSPPRLQAGPPMTTNVEASAREASVHHMTIRNVDPVVKAALEERARADGVSQTEAARQALARGLGVRVPRRRLRGMGREVLGEAALSELSRVDWEAPAFSDEELDTLDREEADRLGGGDS